MKVVAIPEARVFSGEEIGEEEIEEDVVLNLASVAFSDRLSVKADVSLATQEGARATSAGAGAPHERRWTNRSAEVLQRCRQRWQRVEDSSPGVGGGAVVGVDAAEEAATAAAS